MDKLISFVKNKIDYIIVFLCSFIPKVLFTIIVPFIGIISDETSTMSGAALFAGFDWSNTVSNAGYYGGGMTALFAPLFKLIDSPYVLYHCLLIIMCLLQATIGVICYYLFINHLGMKKNKVSMLLSIVASYIVTRRATNVTNEHMLILMSWVLTLLIVKLIDCKNNKEKIKLSILTAAALGYSLTIHTRALTFILAFFILFIVYLWIYRESLVSVVPFLIVFSLFYLGSQYFIGFVQNSNFSLEYGLKLRNSYLPKADIKELLSPDSWYAWLSIIVGQVMTISVFSGGLFIVSIVVTIKLLWQGVLRKKDFLVTNDDNIIKKKLLTVLIFMFMCIGMTILMHSFSNVSNVMLAYQEGTGGYNYGLKAITYIRYFGPYVGPTIALAIVYIYRYRDELKTTVLSSFILVMFLSIIWICCIVPFIYNSTSGKEAFFPFSLNFTTENVAGRSFYIVGIVVLFIVLILITISLYQKKYMFFGCLLIIFFGYEYAFNVIMFDKNLCSTNGTNISMVTYEYLKNIDFDVIDNTVYVYDGSGKTDHQIFYTYQVLLKDKTIEIELPDKNKDTALLVTNDYSSAKYLLDYGYQVTAIENGDYLFAKGEKILKQFDDTLKFCDYDNRNNSINMTNIEDDSNVVSKSQILTLNSGTYHFDFDIQSIDIDKTSLPVIRIIDATTQNSISEIQIEEQGQCAFDVSLTEKKNVYVDLYNTCSKNSVFNSASYVYSDKTIEFGMNYNEDIKKLLDIHNDHIYAYSLRTDLSFDEFNKKLGTTVEKKTYHELLSLNNDSIVICSKNDTDWLELLPAYQVKANFNELVVLSRKTANPLSYNQFADASVFKMFMNEYNTQTYSNISKGEYCLDINILEEINEYGYTYVIYENDNPKINGMVIDSRFINFESINDLNNWKLKIFDIDRNEVDFEMKGISKTSTSVDYYQKTIMKDFQKDIENMNISSFVIYSDELNDNRNQNILKTIDSRVRICKDLNMTNEDVILVSNSEVDLIFDKLSNYDILNKYAQMTCLVKKSYNVETSFNTDDIVNVAYFNKDISLGKGTYAITFEIEVKNNVDDIIGNLICNNICKEINVKELNENKITTIVNSVGNIGQISYVKEEKIGNHFKIKPVSIQRISKGYRVDFSQLSNISIDNNQIISANEDQEIMITIPYLQKNTDYMLEIHYENQDDITFYVNNGDDVVNYNYSSNSEKIDSEYINKIELFSSIDCKSPYVKFELPANSKMKIKSIEFYNMKDIG